MKRCWLVLIPAVFLLLINISVAAEQQTVPVAVTDSDPSVQRQQQARELEDQIDVLAQQPETFGEVPNLPPGVINRNSPWLGERPGNMPFSFEQPKAPRVGVRSPFGEPRPFQYNGMTFWWIPLSATASRVEVPADSPGTVKLLEPK